MAVGATNWSDTKASYSNYGPQIEISAPGGDGNALGTGNSLILAAVHTGDGSYTWKAARRWPRRRWPASPRCSTPRAPRTPPRSASA
jgi:hypothetical protein